MEKLLAFDIGGTKIAYALIDKNGNFVTEVTKQATPDSSEKIYDLLKKTISEYEKDIIGTAIATAGAINKEGKKITSHVGNLPEGYNKLDFMSLSNKPVLLENDANSAGWAEFAIGSAKGCQNVITLTIGTGVGSGIIVEGKLLKGKSGAAGEMHFPIDSCKKRKCTCGIDDCFEIYASGTALNLYAKEYMSENATGYDIIEQKSTNPKARKAFDEWQGKLLQGLIMLGNIFDPEMIVLSGSLSKFIEYERLNKQANEQILTQPFVLKEAKFENNAGMIGVAMLYFDKNL
ncbi:MAG: ROK family protein [Alphaproteobacteria bacterium]|nr:ROK family protein [Alphaproteobacteria bacterium]